jgi:hypothetical protein
VRNARQRETPGDEARAGNGICQKTKENRKLAIWKKKVDFGFFGEASFDDEATLVLLPSCVQSREQTTKLYLNKTSLSCPPTVISDFIVRPGAAGDGFAVAANHRLAYPTADPANQPVWAGSAFGQGSAVRAGGAGSVRPNPFFVPVSTTLPLHRPHSREPGFHLHHQGGEVLRGDGSEAREFSPELLELLNRPFEF